MTQETIGLGTAPNDGTGDDLRTAGAKINENFTELYGRTTPPQGRLTLTSGVRVMTSGVAAAGTIYYTPYQGREAPVYDGAIWSMIDLGGELSQALSDTTKSPAAAANNSNYDLFVWMDGTTARLSRGPAWSSDTARGTGAGTTELDMTTRFITNKVAITNGPGAGRGTYVGTIRTNGTATVDWNLGGLAAGGTAANLGVWNLYNRRPVSVMVRDTTDSWSLAFQANPRAANNSNSMRASFILGLAEDPVSGRFMSIAQAGAGNSAGIGIGIDSTSAFSGAPAWNNGAASTKPLTAETLANDLLGWHYMQALEGSYTSGTATFYGDAGFPNGYQNGLFVSSYH